MKKFTTTFVCSFACALFFCSTICSERAVKENRETGAFRKINMGSGIDVYFTQNDSYSVVVETDKDLIGKIATEVKGETLVINWKEHLKLSFSVFKGRGAKVYVSAPALEAVNAGGGADFYADQLKCDGSFQLDISGGADADIKKLAVSQDIDFSSSGGADIQVGEITVGGKANLSSSGGADVHIGHITVSGKTKIASSGGADCDVKNLQTDECDLTARGGADIDIHVTVSGNLNASESGGSDIDISGKANKVDVSASGGGNIDIRELTYNSINIQKSGGGGVRQ
ncbi:MAG: DUF2807 domain-containing protein [Tannerella sp.]|nr:DUF2807 domain-containing protein [Tannerella sp.]